MYEDKEFTELRFGDIVKGYPSIIPNIQTPFLDRPLDHDINIKIENLLVVVDPCCAIEKGSLSLTPLVQIDPIMMDSPYFSENLLRINELQPPHRSIHPIVWNKYSEKEKIDIINDDPRYPYTNYFIYELNNDLLEYKIKKKRKFIYKIDPKTDLPFYEEEKLPPENQDVLIKYYMIDFKKIFHVLCPKIKNVRAVPLDEEIKRSKLYELSIDARKQLRDKIASYFGTDPMEDIV